MAKLKRKQVVGIFHLALFIVLGFVLYYTMNDIARFASSNELIMSIIVILIPACLIFLHRHVFFKMKLKKK
ncbi:MAG: hypothetical protein ACPKOI_00425 [Pleomorphochaeta sp.]|jgi:hypothetical protein